MPSRLDARLRRLETQAMTSDQPAGQGLAALLDYARRHTSAEDLMPLEALSTAELDEKIAALTGQRGFCGLPQGAPGSGASTATGSPCQASHHPHDYRGPV